ncbi:MAG: hypothetical protein ABFD83_14825 [Armatimonadota bacterium]
MNKAISFSTDDFIERPVKLFEAGSYPDKDIEVTEDDLDNIVANTTEAPIGIEHVPTPFDGAMGIVKNVYRKGKELMGTLRTPAHVWSLMEAAKAKKVSVTIPREKDRLLEVSIVQNPRVASASVFADGRITFTGSVVQMGWDGLTDDQVTSLFRAKLGTGSDDYSISLYPLYEDSAIVQKGDGRYFKYPFSVVDGTLVLGEPVEMEQVWQPKRESAERTTTSMNAEEVRKIVDEAMQSFTETLKAQFSAQIQPLVDICKSSAEAVAQFHSERRVDRVKQWTDEGKLTPEMVPFAEALMAAGGESAKTFAEMVDKMPAKQTKDDGDGEGSQFSDDIKGKIYAGLGVTAEQVEGGK